VVENGEKKFCSKGAFIVILLTHESLSIADMSSLMVKLKIEIRFFRQKASPYGV
jgi:hypothetical protein